MKQPLSVLGLMLLLAPLAGAQQPPTPAPAAATGERPYFTPFANQQPQSALQLFESLASDAAVTRPQAAISATENNGPAFVLVGTSRFGDNYRARLRSSSGEVIAVDVRPGSPTAVPGHPGYTILASDARELQLRHPPGSPCRDATAEGVSCGGGNTARLSLATAAAVEVAPEPVPPRRRDRGRAENGNDVDGEAPPGNPFGAALRNARNLSDEELAELRRRAERFEGRRIDPADVPAGRRVVRTPFGDRFVD